MDTSLVVPQLPAREGVLLRPWRLDDLAVVEEAAGDPYIPLISSVPSNYSDTEGAAFIRRQWSRAADGVGYSFAIADAGNDRALGQIGLWPGPHGRASVGYWVAGSARGRGIACAALRTISSWGLEHLRIPRLELHVEPWNAASWKAAERAGFVREGLLRGWQEIGGERRDMYVYSQLLMDLA
ncbi:GNAT family N-acetyltransferase [Nonomuraea rhodomycinica]|uniref:GNAT family N-acetyltransferase n=1 Tax=Nonomuraea rhodomycinica TaxID=1712872 RepID=A0A7Y6IWV5_9ACTN|nr:GNAT family protein [Nonomuraea rhodomycinica]NUW45869.1 GNAT family N-acetyltransferase [Nonomuraea rhodomycinica]